MKTINEIIYPVLNEIKEDFDLDFENSPELVIFGSSSVFDSLALVSLIVEVESKVQDVAGVSVTLASEKAMSRSSSPFRTVQTLADYVDELIVEAK